MRPLGFLFAIAMLLFVALPAHGQNWPLDGPIPVRTMPQRAVGDLLPGLSQTTDATPAPAAFSAANATPRPATSGDPQTLPQTPPNLLETQLDTQADAGVLNQLEAMVTAAPVPAPVPVISQATPPGNYEDVRNLALEGKRGEALALAEQILAAHPDDLDTRFYYGTILSWEGRYDEARQQLEQVLEKSPGYADARFALINVEIWSGNWERVTELATAGEQLNPETNSYLLARAKALRNLDRPQDAIDVLNQLLEREPNNHEARGLRETIRDSLRRWQVSSNQYYIAFSDSRKHWEEQRYKLTRYTGAGSLSLGATRTKGFGYRDSLYTAEFYPKFRPGTYGYLAMSYSPKAVLYPRTRYAAEIFQSLPKGMEASFGVRQFQFPKPLRLYTVSLTKYIGAYWMVTGRTYMSSTDNGISQSLQMLVRRYIDGANKYFGFRYGIGASPYAVRSINDIQLLKSHTFGGDFVWRFNGGWGVFFSGGISMQNRYQQNSLYQYLLNMGVNYRF